MNSKNISYKLGENFAWDNVAQLEIKRISVHYNFGFTLSVT